MSEEVDALKADPDTGPSGGDSPGEGTLDAPSRPKRRYSEKRVKIVVLVAVVAVVVVILLWGMVPERIYEVKEVVEGEDSFDGEHINVKGVVTAWETDESNFTLLDSNNANLSIRVRHTGPIPEGFGINVTAVVKGVFHRNGGVHSIDSTEIQIGCPSKY
jgi:cytochrome c-type biogenesis protein CcmE